MKLNVLERLLLLGLLPESGSLTTIRIVREQRETLSFKEHEHEVLIFQTLPNGNVRWRSPEEWKTFKRYDVDGKEQWAMLDGAFTFKGKWGEKKKAEYAARCEELVGDGVELEFGKKARQEIKAALEKLNEAKEVKEVHYSLFEKFQLLDDLLDE